jgi:hypothetical protein
MFEGRDSRMTDQSEADDRGYATEHAAAASMKMRADLARLASAFPAFSITICKGWDGPRFEAWRNTTLSGLYAIITDDPGELWRELDMADR